MKGNAMRRNLAVLACASALAAAAGCAPHAPRFGGGPPNLPAAPGAVVAAPTPVSPERSASAQLGSAAAAGPAAPPPTAKWSVNHAGLEGADTRDCLGCHGEAMVAHSHPVEIDYAEATQRARGGFRPIDEVRARGVVLPGGKVGCPTCHSAASPWAHFLAVPRELARPRPGIAELRADEPQGVQAEAPAAPPDGAEVSPRPLCESCHAY